MERIQLFLLIGVAAYLAIILSLLVQGKLNLNHAMLWLMSAVLMMVITIFPDLVTWASHFIGIETPINFVFVIGGMCVLLIILYLTSKVSSMSNQLRRLTQSLALTQRRLREMEKAMLQEQRKPRAKANLRTKAM